MSVVNQMAKKIVYKGSVVSAPKGGEIVKRIPISDIVADFKWNARSVGFENTSGLEPIEHGQDWADFMASIESEGQQDPCDVRPLKGGKFGLVAGFRRFLAVKTIADKAGDKAASLLCVVREMTESQARLRNAIENLGRDDLSVADAAYAAGLARNAAKADGSYTDDKALAAKLGKSQGVVQKYLACYANLKPSVFQAWRTSKFPPIIIDMVGVSKLPLDDQEAKFRELESERAPVAGGKKGKTAAQKAVDGAVRLGTMLGRLARIGAIKDSFDFDRWVPLAVEVSGEKQPTAKQWSKAAADALEAFEAEIGRDEEDDGE